MKFLINKFLFIATSSLIGFTSCLKDKNIDDQKYGMINKGDPKIIEFYDLEKSVAVPIADKDTLISLGTVHLAASAAGFDIPVNISTTNSAKIIEDYNDEHGTSLVELTTAFYQPENSSFAVVIAKGENDAEVRIKINPASLDASETYALGLTLASTSLAGYAISENYQHRILLLSVKNKYDGIYSYTGSIIRNSASGPDMSYGGNVTGVPDIGLITLGPDQVELEGLYWANGLGVGGVDGTYLTIDPATNKVVVACATNPGLKNTPGEVNKYDPTTKTFTLAFDWGTSPATRITKINLKYTGSR